MRISRLRSWLAATLVLLSLVVVGGFTSDPSSSAPADSTDIFMWTGADRMLDHSPVLFRTQLAFIPYESGIHGADELERFLTACRRAGIERTWIEIGPNNGVSARAFATDSTARHSTLERFRALARTYKAHNPESAHITIFDEAPLGAFDPPAGTGYKARVNAFRRYGPKGFALMYRAFKDVMPSAEVGVFLHHPHNASRKMAGPHPFVDSFMAAAAELGATPDFIYSDVYRGYFNRGYGVEATNEYITDVVQHTNAVAERYGAEAHHLGQTHTIKLGYTPSRWEIDTNVRAMLRGNPDGLGWYWPNYASTNYTKGPDGTPQAEGYDVSFDPFVPNSWGKMGPAGSLFATSRDRFVYAYLRLAEATGRLQPRNRFDLWLYGHDFDHVEHTVYARPAGDSSWTFIGAVNPQRDRSGYVPEARPGHMYSGNNRWHAVVFHGLRRANFFTSKMETGPRLEIKIESRARSDTSRLAAAYALPYRATRHYATESKATSLIEQQPRWMTINSLAYHVRPRADTLAPGTARTYRLSPNVPVDSARARSWRNRLDP
ncbi:MAG: hypothetical protein ABEK84_03215 [Salinibacter sp.]